MGSFIRRHIGQILLDGRFMSPKDLGMALEEQKHTRELLGEVLVRMGVLDEHAVKVPLRLQGHLGCLEDAVKTAAGERQLLGALLVESGHITAEQLDHAIAEQNASGDKLGEVFIRLGMLTDLQLKALLDFQHHQGDAKSTGPLRLGELLLATGYISRSQLDDALQKQSVSRKKIGEVLVEEGYVGHERINYGIRLQKMLVRSALAAILSLGVSGVANAQDVQLQWDPNSESDLAGYKVYYAAGSSQLASGGTVNVEKNYASATIKDLDPDKSYTFGVTAYNEAGLESGFSNLVTVAEQSPPTVAITSPAASVNVSDTVTVSIDASDNVGVTKVEYYVDNLLKGTETGSPYHFPWDTSAYSAGAHTILAKAYDAAGNVSQSSRSVTVVKDIIAPDVVLTAPADNVAVSGTVNISSTASDNVGVTRVEFYANGTLLYASNVSPYNFMWDTVNVENGNYTIIAKAYDNAGNARLSSTATVAVNNSVPGVTDPTGTLSISDASIALQVAVGKVKPTAEQKARLDVAPVINGKSTPDGKVNTGDAIVILSKLVGKTI